MTKNFKVRLSVSLFLLVLAAVLIFTFDSVPFKIFFGMFALVAAMELMSFFTRKVTIYNIVLAVIEVVCLVASTVIVAKFGLIEIILLIFGVCGYDVFAYLFGNGMGGVFFGKARPFPHVSKNKTWEGTVMGLVTSFLLTGIIILISGGPRIFLLAGPLALVGDLFESHLKRQFGVKDSNEIVIKKPLFQKLEMLVGGGEGHGGYLDRIDSMAFTGAVLLLIAAIL